MRRILADTVAMITFTTFFGACSELFIVGMTPLQVLATRAGAIPANLVTSRPYGLYRDAVMRFSGALGMRGIPGRLARFCVDTLAFASFKMPVYVVLLRMAGASWSEVGVAVVSAIVLTMALGRVFGMYLDLVRTVMGVPALERPGLAAREDP
ncbi:L-alanine exporter [Aliiruegeria haliotis]|uniref:L-alanine exporter n=1 Tax=Aliiruegeria haliotis TaxID=1280846 RepID=A0A2T0RJC8_9RHOB|nr:L-alanine exporter AlaE [Aliiruegeria haliotis]PRY21220.1 L-alanine exporter [Aliiruegeria haliotis]